MAGPPMNATGLRASGVGPSGGPRLALTKANRRVLCALARVLDREGSASIREVMAEAGLRSVSSVSHHLHKLALHGYIEDPVHNRPRGWRLTKRGSTAATQP